MKRKFVMRLRDFESRFEETLKLNKLQYTVSVREEPCVALGECWTWKEFTIQARTPQWDGPLLVNLGKHHRDGRSYRRGKTSCTCFVVEPVTYFSGARKCPGIKHGLVAVWRNIRIHCLPL